MGTVAIVVPLYKETLTSDERVSLAHLTRFLGEYPQYTMKPDRLMNWPDSLEPVSFADNYFESTLTYNRLLLSKDFYRRFTRFEYILIYQLDCLVFSSDLLRWCSDEWDFIGAPLFHDPAHPESGFSGRCNGGLSLRRVDRALEVLSSRHSYVADERAPRPEPWGRGYVRTSVKDWCKWILGKSDMRRCRQSYAANEDIFWSLEAARFWPGFRVAEAAAALSFSFECAPRFCFEATGGRLPFGVHAWAKHDRKFWEPHLLPSM